MEDLEWETRRLGMKTKNPPSFAWRQMTGGWKNIKHNESYDAIFAQSDAP